MAIVRVHKNTNYTTMSNYHFKERKMSLKAKGLFSLMLSLPDDWDYSIAGLVTLSKDGKDSVMSALNELEQFGYLIRTRLTAENGQFAGYDYDIYESPIEVIKAAEVGEDKEKPAPVKPYAENPNTEKPNAENPPQLNTNVLSTNQLIPNQSSTNKLSTKKNNIKDNAFIPPTVEEVASYCKERNNKINAEQFVDYYISNGWKVGKNKMKDWKAAVRTWERNTISNKKAEKKYGATGVEIKEPEQDDVLAGILG